MVNIQDVIVHFDIFREHFVCDLQKCKGMCCVEGDYGAPLDKKEVRYISKNLENLKKYMTHEARRLLETEGFFERDPDNELVTKCLNGQDCIFTYKDKKSIYKCAIETAWYNKNSNFRKPVSCHLYPIRINKISSFVGVMYNRWHICSPACDLGESNKVPLHIFLEEPLTRKFGKKWYKELVEIAEELKNNPEIM